MIRKSGIKEQEKGRREKENKNEQQLTYAEAVRNVSEKGVKNIENNVSYVSNSKV